MKVNDLVTRKKYNHDIIFKIVGVDGEKYLLQGEFIRLTADAFKDDLVPFDGDLRNYDQREEVEDSIRAIDDYLYGKVLHIDGDPNYLKKSMDMYAKYNIPAVGYYFEEWEIKDKIVNLLVIHRPDILIITGHDSLKIKERANDLKSFTNSEHFVAAVQRARTYQSNKDALVIFAGACQSFYEALIECGANFASSPQRVNIHALDPVGIAIQIASTDYKTNVDIPRVLKNTVSKGVGLGGIDTKGSARRLYLGA